MTFIIAIQLNDSIIIAADNKKITLKNTGEIQFNKDKLSKLYPWKHGLITGTGEAHVIHRATSIFKSLTFPDINELPECLNISRYLRELEVGKGYYQIENTKLLCSYSDSTGVQLYKIERFEPSQEYTMVPIQSMDIIIWLFYPDITLIETDLQSLYKNIKDYQAFPNDEAWLSHYISQLAPIYKKQSKIDTLMSSSFDVFLQTKNVCSMWHIPNQQNIPIDLTYYYEQETNS
ncbi:hypothetical protein F909_03811 [Acinetobacter sp. ANC 3929]|uniref:hypothetical protein n=1 Tax=unclassified Acinetobacter TaxID=196816 RepID=UPI0002CF74AA|nr:MULTISPECIES: hypothetical protein [unclassified Acinetobacter]ENW78127.1 hypothetical protein F909_03811 [Acinetobacter sp. ANC 3929]MCH7351658.1 hypothetical protein [Acinetobacter sp. NIPH 2023]MCH7355343.1 hypothetical protein [Acinetobacter sp. NIPH 1958]MCH7359410.1 hypothetical protein [Acinetobacter sp. NIPH 2024]